MYFVQLLFISVECLSHSTTTVCAFPFSPARYRRRNYEQKSQEEHQKVLIQGKSHILSYCAILSSPLSATAFLIKTSHLSGKLSKNNGSKVLKVQNMPWMRDIEGTNSAEWDVSRIRRVFGKKYT